MIFLASFTELAGTDKNEVPMQWQVTSYVVVSAQFLFIEKCNKRLFQCDEPAIKTDRLLVDFPDTLRKIDIIHGHYGASVPKCQLTHLRSHPK